MNWNSAFLKGVGQHFRQKRTSHTNHFCRFKQTTVALYNLAAESFHIKKFCSRLPSIHVRRKMTTLRFLGPHPLGRYERISIGNCHFWRMGSLRNARVWQTRTDRSTGGRTDAYRNTAAALLQRGKNWLTLQKPPAIMKTTYMYCQARVHRPNAPSFISSQYMELQ